MQPKLILVWIQPTFAPSPTQLFFFFFLETLSNLSLVHKIHWFPANSFCSGQREPLVLSQ